MAITDNDIRAFISLMPEDMKKNAVKGLEFLRGTTIADYKAKQIETAELLITDVQNNPDNYSTASLSAKIRETLGLFKVSKELQEKIDLVSRFIGMKNVEVIHGSQRERERVERNNNMTYEEFLKSREPKYKK
jgi:hypothetical protein